MKECYSCGSTVTYMSKNGKWPNWYYNYDIENNVLCGKCNTRYITNLKWSKINSRIYNPRKIRFLGKRIILSWDFRKYICLWCNKNVKRSEMHHYFYIPCMPWACMEELCIVCHNKTKDKLILGEWKHRKQSEYTRLKRSQSLKGNLNLAFWKGKKMSEESSIKKSLALIGNKNAIKNKT